MLKTKLISFEMGAGGRHEGTLSSAEEVKLGAFKRFLRWLHLSSTPKGLLPVGQTGKAVPVAFTESVLELEALFKKQAAGEKVSLKEWQRAGLPIAPRLLEKILREGTMEDTEWSFYSGKTVSSLSPEEQQRRLDQLSRMGITLPPGEGQWKEYKENLSKEWFIREIMINIDRVIKLYINHEEATPSIIYGLGDPLLQPLVKKEGMVTVLDFASLVEKAGEDVKKIVAEKESNINNYGLAPYLCLTWPEENHKTAYFNAGLRQIDNFIKDNPELRTQKERLSTLKNELTILNQTIRGIIEYSRDSRNDSLSNNLAKIEPQAISIISSEEQPSGGSVVTKYLIPCFAYCYTRSDRDSGRLNSEEMVSIVNFMPKLIKSVTGLEQGWMVFTEGIKVYKKVDYSVNKYLRNINYFIERPQLEVRRACQLAKIFQVPQETLISKIIEEVQKKYGPKERDNLINALGSARGKIEKRDNDQTSINSKQRKLVKVIDDALAFVSSATEMDRLTQMIDNDPYLTLQGYLRRRLLDNG